MSQPDFPLLSVCRASFHKPRQGAHSITELQANSFLLPFCRRMWYLLGFMVHCSYNNTSSQIILIKASMGLSELHCKLGILKLRHKPLPTFFSPHIGKTPIDCNRRTWCALQREIISSVLETTQNQTNLSQQRGPFFIMHFISVSPSLRYS